MKKILPGILLLVFVGGLLWGFPLSGVRADELTKTTQELNAKKEQLRKAEAALKSAREREAALSSGVSGLQAALEVAQAEAVVKQAEAEEALADFARQEALLQQREELYAVNTRGLYKRMMAARAMAVATLLDAENIVTYARLSDYQAKMLEQEQERVLGLAEEVSGLEKRKIELKGQADKALADKKNLEQRMANLQWQIANARSTQASSSAAISGLGKEVQFLDVKHKQLLEAELAKMNNTTQTGQKELLPGQYFFLGRGRDLIDGHGMGMSQWGAYGMALKGWNYQQILTFYYPGVVIGSYAEPDKIYVEGCGNPCKGAANPMPFDTYLSGIGEMIDSWPVEAVNTQIVAARTYVMRAGRDIGGGVRSICGTDACQVYKGGMGKAAHVQATKGKVILYNGSPIVAYYSASHRGYSTTLWDAWGSSNLPYIKPVNDDAYAYKDYRASDPYNPGQMIKPYSWTWRTNGYTLEQLTSIFSRDSRLNVGQLKNIVIVKDAPQKRVSRITLVGSERSVTLTGWTFRSIFNATTQYDDFLYSTEFTFQQK